MDLWQKFYSFFLDAYNNPILLGYFVNNRFFLILLVIFLTRIKNMTYSSIWGAALINLPGTFLHELMHFIVGLLLNARPQSFSVFPKRSIDGGYITGHVTFSNIRFYNAFPTSVAPLALLFLGFYMNRYLLPKMDITFLNYIGYVLLQTIIIENALPSSVDIKTALKFPLGAILYLFIFAVAFYFI